MVMFLVCLCSALISFALYLLSTWKFNYWNKKNVPHLKPTPLLGNYGNYILLRKTMAEVAQNICKQYPQEPYVGAYYGTEPTLILQDPELIKLVTTKDFYYFNGREVSNYTDREISTRNLFFTHGDRWKVTRQHMTPLFTTAKLKMMFPLIQKCTHMFEEMLDREMSVSDSVEARELISKYTMDSICSCGFGIDANTMADDSSNVFTVVGEKIFENSNIRALALITRAIWPAIFYGSGLIIYPKKLTGFFHDLLTGVFTSRKYIPSNRNDFVDMVLNLKKSEFITCDSFTKAGQKVTLEIDDEFLVAQCGVFFAAGYETSATTLGFTVYELAKHEDVQKKAMEEVDDYLKKHEGKIDYDCLSELPYLEACVDETMRLYPVLGLLTREVMEDYTLPSGLKLDKGVRIHLPVYHMHHNPEYFPEPEQFRPERFLLEAKKDIKPYTYMPFGEGPRICIGMRIAKMQMLPGLVTLLKKYRVALAAGTPRVLEFDPRAFVTQARTGINLKLVRREGWEQRIFKK